MKVCASLRNFDLSREPFFVKLAGRFSVVFMFFLMEKGKRLITKGKMKN